MKKEIIIKFTLFGLHNWPNCNIEEVSYLQYLHRHEFFFELTIPVTHNDRDIEFIQFRNKVVSFLNDKYFSNLYQCLNFASSSCEAIAEYILDNFSAVTSVKVFEDNENGALVSRE